MDATTALSRMRDLLRPDDTLAVVGLARSTFPADLPLDLAGVLASRLHRLTKSYWEHPSPTVWPPPGVLRNDAAPLRPGPERRPLPPSPSLALLACLDQTAPLSS